MAANDRLTLAVPRGRILSELVPLLVRAGVEPEAAFADENARQLRFATNQPALEIVRVPLPSSSASTAKTPLLRPPRAPMPCSRRVQ